MAGSKLVERNPEGAGETEGGLERDVPATRAALDAARLPLGNPSEPLELVLAHPPREAELLHPSGDIAADPHAAILAIGSPAAKMAGRSPCAGAQYSAELHDPEGWR